jgi:hypothetical protein
MHPDAHAVVALRAGQCSHHGCQQHHTENMVSTSITQRMDMWFAAQWEASSNVVCTNTTIVCTAGAAGPNVGFALIKAVSTKVQEAANVELKTNTKVGGN